jgi:outer membrane protein assembly factor BamB
VKTADTDFRWDGRSWSGRRRAVLAGGLFVAQANAASPTMAYSSLQDINGKLIWEEGNRRFALTSPRSGLALATAAAVPGGRIYVGTTGDGLYLFEP